MLVERIHETVTATNTAAADTATTFAVEWFSAGVLCSARAWLQGGCDDDAGHVANGIAQCCPLPLREALAADVTAADGSLPRFEEVVNSLIEL